MHIWSVYMSRPKPKVLLELTNKKTYKTEQVLEADAIWAVFYQEKPINLANKLNKMFNVKDFSVYKLTTGEKLTDDSET